MLPADFDTGGSMRSILTLLAATLTLATSLLAAPPTPSHFDGKTWWKHVPVPAEDKLEGREKGGPRLAKGQGYSVAQLTRGGLPPARRQGLQQPVKFIQREIDESGSSAALVRDGKPEPL